MKHHTRMFAGLAALTLASLAMAPSAAHAIAWGWLLPAPIPEPRMLCGGQFQFVCMGAPAPFAGTPVRIGPPAAGFAVVQGDVFCGTGSFAIANWWYPAAGKCGCRAAVIGLGAADVASGKLRAPQIVQADTLDDSLQVTVTARTASSVSFTFNGFARNYNPVAASQTRAIGKLQIFVYPDSNVANADTGNNGTGATATGTMTFEGSATRTVSGTLFSAGDFTTPASFGDGTDYVVSTNGTVSKTVTGLANGNAAIVRVLVDPVASNTVVPMSTPLTLSLLAALLLGASAFLVARRRTHLA